MRSGKAAGSYHAAVALVPRLCGSRAQLDTMTIVSLPVVSPMLAAVVMVTRFSGEHTRSGAAGTSQWHRWTTSALVERAPASRRTTGFGWSREV